jgi:hypothetical protein
MLGIGYWLPEHSAPEAAFSGDEWSIPVFRADFLPFTSKIVEHSRYFLPMIKVEAFRCYGQHKEN